MHPDPIQRAKQKLAPLIAYSDDFEAAKRACTVFIEQVLDASDEGRRDPNDPLHEALHNAVVASYTRPYSSNTYGSLAGSELATYTDAPYTEKPDGERWNVLHKDLMMLRDKCVAHSDRAVKLVEAELLEHLEDAPYMSPGSKFSKFEVAVTQPVLPAEDVREVLLMCRTNLTRLSMAMHPLFFDAFPAAGKHDAPGATQVSPRRIRVPIR